MIAPDIEGETAEGNGDGAGDDAGNGNEGDTTSSSSVDLIQVKAVLLAAESQPMHQTQRTRSNDLHMSSGSPIRHANRLYGLVRPHCQCRRIKFTPIKVNTVRKDKTTYRGRASTAQPPVIDLKCAYRVIGLRCRRGRIKIEAIKVNQAQEVETTHQVRASIAQPCGNAPNRQYGVHRTHRHRGRIKIKSTNVSRMRMDGSTYLGCVNAI